MTRVILAPSILLVVGSSVISAFLMAVFWGTLTADIAFASLLTGCLAGILHLFLHPAKPHEEGRLSRPAMVFILLYLVLCFRYASGLLAFRSGFWTTLPAGEMEIPLFAATVRYLTGASFWPSNPLLGGTVLHDFGMETFAALLALRGMAFYAFMPFLATGGVLLMLAALLRWQGAAALGGFLFLGGTAGLIVLLEPFFPELGTALSHGSILHAVLPYGLFFSNPDFIYVFPCGLWLLSNWRKRFLEHDGSRTGFAEMVLWSSLAVFHLQSFLFVSLVYLFWVPAARLPWWKKMSPAVKVLLVLGPFFCVLSKGGGDWSAFLDIYRRTAGYGENFFTLAVKNYGWVLLWAIVPAGASLFAKGKTLRPFILPALGVLIAVLFFETGARRHEADALTAWCFLMMVPAFAAFVRPWKPWKRAAFWTVLFLPGLVVHFSNAGFFHRPVMVEDADGSAFCRQIGELPPGGRFAVTMEYNHPLALCGAEVVTVFNDAFFAWGSRERRTSEKLRRLMMGEPAWRELAGELNVRYIFWGPLEERDFSGSLQPWKDSARTIASGPWGEVYDIGSPGMLESTAEAGRGLKVRVYAGEDSGGEPLRAFRAVMPAFLWDDSHTEALSVPFNLVFQGQVFVPETGETTFYLASDDGSELEINGNRIIDNLGQHPVRIMPGTAVLEPGWHDLRIRYHENGGVGMMKLWWKRPSGKEERIPEEYFRPGDRS